jgi:hypothetical protein
MPENVNRLKITTALGIRSCRRENHPSTSLKVILFFISNYSGIAFCIYMDSVAFPGPSEY